VIGQLDKLALDSFSVVKPWLAREQENLEIFSFGVPEAEYSDDDTITVNEIQSAILATTPKEPARIELTPVETDDPGVIVSIPTGAPAVDEMGAPMVDETGLPVPGMAEYQVNDLLVKKVYQKLFDVYWQRSRIDEIMRRGRIWTRVKGWQFYLYGFDDENQRIVLRTLSNAQCYPDRIQEFVQDFAYFGVDEYLDAAFAKSMYPDIAEQIEAESTEGEQSTSVGNQPTPTRYKGTFQRPMVCLTTFWLRYERGPMKPEQAVADGKVIEVEYPTGMMTDAVDEMGQPLVDEFGVAVTEPEVRVGYALPDGTEVAEGDPAWPTKQIIREIQVLAGTVVADRECEHWDMPILHDVHVPVFGTPFGLGDPFKLKKLQNAESRMLNSMVVYCETLSQPIRAMPQSVYQATKQEYGRAYIDPSMTIIVPDSVYQMTGGKLDMTANAAPMNAATPQTFQLIKGVISEQSGYTQELKGIASNPDQSGRQTALLSQNASSLNEFMGRSEEEVLYRLARLILHSLVTRLQIPQIAKICSAYPPAVLEQIVAKAQSMDWDISVAVSTASGMLNEAKRAIWQNDLAIGAISLQTYRELTGTDHEEEEKRVGLQMATALATQAQAGANGPQKESANAG
jgi:hypothetical protein